MTPYEEKQIQGYTQSISQHSEKAATCHQVERPYQKLTLQVPPSHLKIITEKKLQPFI